MFRSLKTASLLIALAAGVLSLNAAVFDITTYGAKGDGQTENRDAINKAIAAAAAAGGGTVEFPAGKWVTGSIHLESNITLHFQPGAILQASSDGSTYDPPEPNQWDKFQDFGHSHFHNGFIWGENLENVAVTGPGLISGAALTRGDRKAGGDKAITLKLCHNVTLRDFSILNGGHFGILATGVDNLIIDSIMIDTNRDGIDIDSCRNVRISNSSINSPNDDAITLKGTHALGYSRLSENITIVNCMVSGFDIGSLLDGTFKQSIERAPDRDGPTGRIKIGTESEGDFRNIAISNVVFDTSRGLALESVDGSHIEDVTVSNITMRNVSNSAIFIRLGSRMRAPEGTPIGTIRHINISNVIAEGVDPRYASIISGIPGHDVEDVRLSGIRLLYRGGLTLEDVAKQSPDKVNTFFFRASGGVPPREAYDTPEREKEYPEPSMFGMLPGYGFFIRHAKDIELNDVKVSYATEDRRPPFVIDSASSVAFINCKAKTAPTVPAFVLLKSQQIAARDCVINGVPLTNFQADAATRQEIPHL